MVVGVVVAAVTAVLIVAVAVAAKKESRNIAFSP